MTGGSMSNYSWKKISSIKKRMLFQTVTVWSSTQFQYAHSLLYAEQYRMQSDAPLLPQVKVHIRGLERWQGSVSAERSFQTRQDGLIKCLDSNRKPEAEMRCKPTRCLFTNISKHQNIHKIKTAQWWDVVPNTGSDGN